MCFASCASKDHWLESAPKDRIILLIEENYKTSNASLNREIDAINHYPVSPKHHI